MGKRRVLKVKQGTLPLEAVPTLPAYVPDDQEALYRCALCLNNYATKRDLENHDCSRCRIVRRGGWRNG